MSENSLTRKKALELVDAVLSDLESFTDTFLSTVRDVTGPAAGMTEEEIEATTAGVEMFSKVWVARYRSEMKEKFGGEDD